MIRALLFIAGMLICGVKGLLLPVLLIRPGEQDKEDMFDNLFGLADPRMDRHWEKIGWSRPAHWLTNVVVEWTRLNPQRGAKAFCALLLITIAVLFL